MVKNSHERNIVNEKIKDYAESLHSQITPTDSLNNGHNNSNFDTLTNIAIVNKMHFSDLLCDPHSPL